MKTVISKCTVFAAVVVGISLGSQTEATLITPTSQYYTASAPPWAPPGASDMSNNDLVNAGQPTYLSVSPAPNVPQQASSSTGGLNDGIFGDPASQNGGWPVYVNASLFNPTDGQVVTFTLDTSAKIHGYNLTQIRSWAVTPGLAGCNQSYDVAVHYVGAAPGSFDLLSSPRNLGVDVTDPYVQANLNFYMASKVAVGDGTSVMASGVDQIQFKFYNVVGYSIWAPPGYDGSTPGLVSAPSVYGEIDVFGSAVIPEPSVAALLLMGVGAWWLRRR